MIPTTLGVAFVIFTIYHAAPGDPATVMMGSGSGGEMGQNSDTQGRVEKFKQRFDWEKGKAAEVIDQAEEQRTEKNRKQLEQEEATRKEAAERKSAREDRRRKILDSNKKKAKEQAEAKAAEEAAAAAEAPAADDAAAEKPADTDS